jgi:hypothetical protein
MPVLRRLFNLCAAISLALWIATAVLWAHSYRADDFLSAEHTSAMRETAPDDGRPAWHRVGGGISAEANCARLEVCYSTVDEWLYTDGSHVECGFRLYHRANRNPANAFGGQSWFDWSNTFNGDNVVGEAALRVPLPGMLLLTALLPAMAFERMLRRRRRPESICRVCGYDCRGTPGRCPECGAGYAARVS